MVIKDLQKKIKKLKKEKKAIILAHNYQYPEIYDISDYIGDSYGLARAAKGTKAKIIVFCGVKFMAETAKILNPGKKVLLPSFRAGCFLANMINASQLKKLKKAHPRAKVVSYVNSSVEVKAQSDICCTSSNALKVIESLSSKEIIFVPDGNLADYIQQFTDKKIISISGFCLVHTRITEKKIKNAKKRHPKAKIIMHPETPLFLINRYADYVTSTSGMVEYAKNSHEKEFLIGTECGMLERLKREMPDKKFYALMGDCVNMKQITLSNTYESLMKEKYEIKINKQTAMRARKAIDKMMGIK